MAKRPENKKFLELEGVRAFYDNKLDRISLTAKDEDVPQFNVVLKPGTPTEASVREVMRREGLIAPKGMAVTSPWGVAPQKGMGSAKVITVTGTRGGSGKTSVSLALAHELTKLAGKVLVIDGDFRDGQLGYLGLNKSRQYNTILTAFAAMEAGLKPRLALKGAVTPSFLGDLLYAPKRAATADVLGLDNFLPKLLKEATLLYDFVIIDSAIAYTGNDFVKIFMEYSTHVLLMERIPYVFREDIAKCDELLRSDEEKARALRTALYGDLLPGGSFMAEANEDNAFYVAEYLQKLSFYFTDFEILSEERGAFENLLASLMGANYGGLLSGREFSLKQLNELSSANRPLIQDLIKRIQ